MVDHTFPQNDDPNDAENFGEWGGRQNISDYVEYGLNFQNIDYGNLVFDVTEGKCYTLAPDATAATTGELRHRIDYGIHLDARGGKTLTDNDINHVWVKPNVGTDDAPEIVVNTTGTAPTDASLKIGELDTNNNTATELNRRPDVKLGDADIERLAAALDANGQDITGVGAFEGDSVSTDESVTVTDDDTIAYGRDHGATVQGDNVVVGVGARALEDVNQTVSGNDPRKVVVGFGAAKNDEQFGVTAAGYRAAENNTGSNLTAAGYRAARNNTGDRVTAVGNLAALNNTGNNLTAAGHKAARGDGLADPTTMGDNNIGLGQNAIRNNQASGLIAIGQDAGINAQTDDQLIITQRDGTRRMVMDLTTGDLSITGSLTENASL